MDDIEFNEHKLAKIAEQIYELTREIDQLKEKKEAFSQNKPQADKEKLTFRESLEFAEKRNKYEQDLKEVNNEILKTERQITALEVKAKKMIPVSGVKIEVSEYTRDGNPIQTYCIQYIKTDSGDTKGHFEVEVV